MFYTRTGVPVKLLWLRKVEFREERIRPREIPEGSLRSLPPDPELELPRPSVAVAADCADVPPLRGQPGAARRPATVYFTLGTVFNLESGDLFERVLAGLAELEIDVVATVGAEIDPAELGPLPPHVRVERFLPQSRSCPGAAPSSRMPARAVCSGRWRTGCPRSVHETASAVLSEPGYRAAAERLQRNSRACRGRSSPSRR